jgi:hypothetical protein
MAISMVAQFTGIGNRRHKSCFSVEAETTNKHMSGILGFRKLSYITKLYEGFFSKCTNTLSKSGYRCAEIL